MGEWDPEGLASYLAEERMLDAEAIVDELFDQLII